MFSSRVPADLSANPFSLALRRARAGTHRLIDLTITNPTLADLAYAVSPGDAFANADADRYDPQPLGIAAAREAVAGDYLRRGIPIPPDRIVLTASTSEAYSVLLKLLCEPCGDNVLVPVPSYPLFDHLTRLDGVAAAEYRLEYHGVWTVDFDTLDRAWSAGTRAVLAVSPNNPTGSILTDAERDALSARCADRDAALILDEVFADYPLEDESGRQRHDEGPEPACLTFRLGGLSKSAGLPQVKLGWIAVGGPAALVDRALARLELICDTYLSVSTPVQAAAPALIATGAEMRRRILDRIRTNYRRLRDAAAPYPAIDVLPAAAGWSSIVRIPAGRSEEEVILELLERDGVVVYPGYFFDFPHEAFLVSSLLPEPRAFAEGIDRLLRRLDA